MKLTSSLRKIGGQLINPWVAATAMAGLLMAAPTTYAAAPPANTLIGNQASATYLDSNGQAQTSTSNQVQTTIQQVGSYNLDGFTTAATNLFNTKTGAAGTTVYAPHILTNTGNGTDSFDISVNVPGPAPGTAAAGPFNRVAVFKDANFDGLPDDNTELCSTTAATGVCTVLSQSVAGNGGKYGFVVAYTLPATATAPTTPYNSGLITAKPVAGSLSLYTTQSITDSDNINLTTAAAFNLSKAIAQPGAGVTAPGNSAWPIASNSGQRSSSATCATTWPVTSSATCQYTVFTLTYNNTGGAPGKFVMKDVIGTAGSATAGLTYVANSAVWSNEPGVGMADAGTPTAARDFKVTTVGNESTVVFVDNNLPVNVTRSVSFVVLINPTAALGTSTTTNTATYNPTDGGPATAGNPGTTGTNSNGSPYTTTGTYSLTLSSLAGSAITGKDTPTAGTPNNNDNDTTTVPSAPVGGSVSFSVKVWNTGNAVDTVNIAALSAGTAGGTAFPAGTIFQYFKADGATPLSDTNGDTKVDTGVIQPGDSTTIVVKAILPATVTPGTGPFTLTVTGTSANDTTAIDATKDVLTSVTGSPVDITNTPTGTTSGAGADVGPGPSASPTTTLPVTAGSTVAFKLYVKNNLAESVSYVFAASSSNAFPGTLPAGWTVKFVAGEVESTACAAASAITTPASVAGAAQLPLTACVTVPASQAPTPTGTSLPLYFQVKSSAPTTATSGVVIDVKYDAVTVSSATTKTAIIGPATSTGQTTPGGSVVYPQTLTNTGTATCTGPYTVEAIVPDAGWQAAIYIDVNNDGLLDAGDTLLPADGKVTGDLLPAPNASSSKKFLLKIFSPGGAAVGATDTATLKVTFPADSCGAPTSTSTTTIVTGQIRVLKTQAIDEGCTGAVGSQVKTNLQAKPGQCITYVVTATNEGNVAVNNLMIRDAVPTYTSLNGTQPATQCASSGVKPSEMANGNFLSANNAVQCGSTSNTVPPGATMTMTFQVQINQNP